MMNSVITTVSVDDLTFTQQNETIKTKQIDLIRSNRAHYQEEYGNKLLTCVKMPEGDLIVVNDDRNLMNILDNARIDTMTCRVLDYCFQSSASETAIIEEVKALLKSDKPAIEKAYVLASLIAVYTGKRLHADLDKPANFSIYKKMLELPEEVWAKEMEEPKLPISTMAEVVKYNKYPETASKEYEYRCHAAGMKGRLRKPETIYQTHQKNVEKKLDDLSSKDKLTALKRGQYETLDKNVTIFAKRFENTNNEELNYRDREYFTMLLENEIKMLQTMVDSLKATKETPAPAENATEQTATENSEANEGTQDSQATEAATQSNQVESETNTTTNTEQGGNADPTRRLPAVKDTQAA